MTKTEKFFFLLSILYFLFCLYGVTTVSQWISDFIRENGWSAFNEHLFPILYFTGGSVCGMLILRARLFMPTWREWLFMGFGLLASIVILNSIVLLTTELIHIPQFAIITILLLNAFPRWRVIAFGWSATACIADEWSQSFLPNRVLDINDILLNLIGMYIGILIYWAFSLPPKTEELNTTT